MRINIITTKNTFIFLLGLIASVPFLAVAANGELAPNPDSLPDSESYTFKVVDDISLRSGLPNRSRIPDHFPILLYLV